MLRSRLLSFSLLRRSRSASSDAKGSQAPGRGQRVDELIVVPLVASPLACLLKQLTHLFCISLFLAQHGQSQERLDVPR